MHPHNLNLQNQETRNIAHDLQAEIVMSEDEYTFREADESDVPNIATFFSRTQK